MLVFHHTQVRTRKFFQLKFEGLIFWELCGDVNFLDVDVNVFASEGEGNFRKLSEVCATFNEVAPINLQIILPSLLQKATRKLLFNLSDVIMVIMSSEEQINFWNSFHE